MTRLSPAQLSDSGADLGEANLGANLQRAILTNINVTSKQLVQSQSSEDTSLEQSQ